jgi:hypothetical protein
MVSLVRNPSAARLRLLAWLAALVLAVVAWHLGPSLASLVLRLVGAGIFAIGTLWPGTFYGMHLFLSVLAFPLLWIGGVAWQRLAQFGPARLARLTGSTPHDACEKKDATSPGS